MLQRGGAITERVALRAAELEQNVEGLASKIRNAGSAKRRKWAELMCMPPPT